MIPNKTMNAFFFRNYSIACGIAERIVLIRSTNIEEEWIYLIIKDVELVGIKIRSCVFHKNFALDNYTVCQSLALL